MAARRPDRSAPSASGRHSDVVPLLEALVAEHPLHERFSSQLMLALEQRTLLRRTELERLAADRDLERTENPEVHAALDRRGL